MEFDSLVKARASIYALSAIGLALNAQHGKKQSSKAKPN